MPLPPEGSVVCLFSAARFTLTCHPPPQPVVNTPGMGWGLLCELNVLLCDFEWPFNPEMNLFYWLLLYSIIKYCV